MPVECLTAEDVRAQARRVIQKRREFETQLQRQRLQAVGVPPPVIEQSPPPPPPVIVVGTPKGKNLVNLVLENEDKVRSILEAAQLSCAHDPKRRPTIADIQIAICVHYNINRNELTSASRTRRITVPRQLCFALCRKLTTSSLSQIGKFHGGKDHTTVLHGSEKLRWLMDALGAELTAADSVNDWVQRAVGLLAERGARG